VDHVAALVALAVQEASPSRRSEQTNALTGVLHRVSALDVKIGDLSSRIPTIEQFELFTEHMEELLSHLPALKKVCPLGDHMETILSIVGQVEALAQLFGQVETLMPLVQRVERVEPLVAQVAGLLPLSSQVAELQASLQTITELQKAAAEPSPQSQSSALSQLRSPPAERHISPAGLLLSGAGPVPTSLLPSPEVDSSPQRSSKKRRIEDMVESLEERFDSIRNEVDNVTWDVAELGEQMSRSKRLRLGGPGMSASESGETTGLDISSVQRSDESAAWKKRIEEDLDEVLRVVSQLWQAEGVWPERLEAGLERAWAKSLKLRQHGDESTGLAIARLMNALRTDVDVLRLAVEAQGPGTMVSGSTTANVATERLVGQVLEKLSKEQTMFRAELEEWMGKTMKPVKDVCKALGALAGAAE
jgi:hypothetical protein